MSDPAKAESDRIIAKYHAHRQRIVDDILRDIAELPDRTSPEDQPDMMMVTRDELTLILKRHF